MTHTIALYNALYFQSRHYGLDYFKQYGITRSYRKPPCMSHGPVWPAVLRYAKDFRKVRCCKRELWCKTILHHNEWFSELFRKAHELHQCFSDKQTKDKKWGGGCLWMLMDIIDKKMLWCLITVHYLLYLRVLAIPKFERNWCIVKSTRSKSEHICARELSTRAHCRKGTVYKPRFKPIVPHAEWGCKKRGDIWRTK